MSWIIVFVASWILFFILRRPDPTYKTYIAGVLAILMQLSIDINAHYLDLYYIHSIYLSFHGSPLCFTFGPVFVMGVLFVQYLPFCKTWQILHIGVFVTLFFVFELFVLWLGDLEYVHWNYYASMYINVMVFLALAWYGTLFVQEKRQEER
ncbi:hypothetical protein BHU72_01280 [Desulfuribacillus stibiiarsenatis]|uniref:Uncharacterized protein n=1 Tax=Desulfuribacillus stibiiarsenatis TaxID=1390249 RepID=A0A1E5L9W9_9FIRM|nr:hypothetical protein [Desulfuribacillus stibiiarsenatis]OEH86922.1 hypothetical protein BHU72_01280 [Desulfuribacillus stibiiarsenatis]